MRFSAISNTWFSGNIHYRNLPELLTFDTAPCIFQVVGDIAPGSHAGAPPSPGHKERGGATAFFEKNIEGEQEYSFFRTIGVDIRKARRIHVM